jgi:hypothetical protein
MGAPHVPHALELVAGLSLAQRPQYQTKYSDPATLLSRMALRPLHR